MSMIRTLLCISILIGKCCFVVAQTGPGYLLLKEEKKNGAPSISTSIKILDVIVEKCINDIKINSMQSREMLTIIGKNIFEYGYTFKENHSTYSEALTSKKFDCDQFALTFLTVCRQMKLPAHVVVMPKHMAIVWKENDSLIFWETTINAEKPSKDYIEDFQISEEGISNKVWLYPISLKDESAIIYDYVGTNLMIAGKYDQSIPYFEKALSIMPKLASSKNNLGVALRRQGKSVASKNALKANIRNDPSDYLSLNNIGLLFYDVRQYDSALFYFEKSIQIEHDYAISLYNRGLVLSQGFKKYDDAIKDYDHAINLIDVEGREASDCFINKGVCFIYKKENAEAVKNFYMALKADSTNSNAWVNMAIAKYNSGNKSEACDHITMAVKMGNTKGAAYKSTICR